MNEKDAVVIKTLAELGLHKGERLTPEQELLFKRAIDPEEEFYHQVQQIFKINESFDDNDFTNKELTKDHLFRKLLSRYNEILTYMYDLKKKYPDFSINQYTDRTSIFVIRNANLHDLKRSGTIIMNAFNKIEYWLTDYERHLLNKIELLKFTEKQKRLVKSLDQFLKF